MDDLGISEANCSGREILGFVWVDFRVERNGRDFANFLGDRVGLRTARRMFGRAKDREMG